MTERDFCYWLQGLTELTSGQTPNPAQWKSIKEHLDLVFRKVTPEVGNVEVKIDVNTKNAQKSIDDLKKAYDDLAKVAKEGGSTPFWPNFSPIWLDEGTRAGWPPGTIIC